MKITAHKTGIRTIKHTDPRFHISDGMITAARAGFEISCGCPYTYREIIEECLRQGWLKPVAHMTEREMLFGGLGGNDD